MKFLKTIFATLVVFLMLSNSSCMGTQKMQTTNDGSIPVRVVESYGSVCCPRDPLHDHHLKNFVKNFNDKHKTHISEMYRLIRGREGEGYLYLTLNELTPKMRKVFVEERKAETKDVKLYQIDENMIDNPVELKDLLKKEGIETTDFEKYKVKF